jgi:dihydroorotase
VLKRETHRVALVQAATSGNPKFFLGTDSAPHPAHLKEHATGCAGCYTAHAAMEMYAEAFDAVGALDKLEGFASFFGADFYGLPRNTGTITLRKESWTAAGELRLRRGRTQTPAFGRGAAVAAGDGLIDWAAPWLPTNHPGATWAPSPAGDRGRPGGRCPR